MSNFYFHGDAAEYTGETKFLHGAICYAYVLIEGHNKGKIGWTYVAPKAVL